VPHQSLLKGGMLVFWTFSTLERIGCTGLQAEEKNLHEINDFHLAADYNLLVLFDTNLNIWVLRYTDFTAFECIVKVNAHSLLGENVLYKNVAQRAYQNLYL
jgi:hypothetical protein